MQVKPLPYIQDGTVIEVDATWARQINDHCQAMYDEIQRLTAASV